MLHSSWTSVLHGARWSSSLSDIFSFGRCSNRNFKYSYRFNSYAFAISTIIRYIVFAIAPAGVSENSQFLRPTVTGRMLFSLKLFSIDYYEMIFRATQSVELFCAYWSSAARLLLLEFWEKLTFCSASGIESIKSTFTTSWTAGFISDLLEASGNEYPLFLSLLTQF